MDGGSITAPTFRFLDTGGEWAVEGIGVAPDIEVIDRRTSSRRATTRAWSADRGAAEAARGTATEAGHGAAGAWNNGNEAIDVLHT